MDMDTGIRAADIIAVSVLHLFAPFERFKDVIIRFFAMDL